MINSDQNDANFGAMVQCPGCRSAFPASEVNPDDGPVFRCASCRTRSRHSYMIATQAARSAEEKSYGEGFSNRDDPNQPSAARRSPKRVEPVQPKPAE